MQIGNDNWLALKASVKDQKFTLSDNKVMSSSVAFSKESDQVNAQSAYNRQSTDYKDKAKDIELAPSDRRNILQEN